PLPKFVIAAYMCSNRRKKSEEGTYDEIKKERLSEP
ncbi:hypothetical protein LCGC14_2339870, partial [marine sediment metagenome]